MWGRYTFCVADDCVRHSRENDPFSDLRPTSLLIIIVEAFNADFGSVIRAYITHACSSPIVGHSTLWALRAQCRTGYACRSSWPTVNAGADGRRSACWARSTRLVVLCGRSAWRARDARRFVLIWDLPHAATVHTRRPSDTVPTFITRDAAI